jgi:dihydropyrimidinase
MLPVLYTEGVMKDRITINKLIELCCENNAKRFGLFPRKGTISPGSDADIVVLDTKSPRIVNEMFYHTRTPDISIYWGHQLFGVPKMTIRRGEFVVHPDCPQLPSQGACFLKHRMADQL